MDLCEYHVEAYVLNSFLPFLGSALTRYISPSVFLMFPSLFEDWLWVKNKQYLRMKMKTM